MLLLLFKILANRSMNFRNINKIVWQNFVNFLLMSFSHSLDTKRWDGRRPTQLPSCVGWCPSVPPPTLLFFSHRRCCLVPLRISQTTKFDWWLSREKVYIKYKKEILSCCFTFISQILYTTTQATYVLFALFRFLRVVIRVMKLCLNASSIDLCPIGVVLFTCFVHNH
jgi:hypothetical protein